MMKKILLSCLIAAISGYGFGQLTGTGSAADPYSGGTLITDLTWNPATDTIYMAGDITIGTSGHLIVSSGVFVKFVASNVDIIITGTGRITAQGTALSKITFTADHDRDNVHGEVGERWGHISFQSMSSDAGPSIFEHCIFEYGDVSSASGSDNPNRYGGAMHLDFSDVAISNCEFRYNKAGWGGAIFVSDGRFPSISNSYIHNNQATTSGGGLYLWRNSSATITNTIIINNSSTGTGGGGGMFLGGAAKGVKVINCLISNNTATSQTLGHNIRFFNNTATPKPQFINCIIWQPANSIVGSSFDADFLYCAIQNPPRSTYTGTVPLNSLNEGSNPSGPFFESMSGESWTLQFLSPCRDNGTNLGAPASDYLGLPTIHTKDIGAFEYQYSRWRTDAGSTDWSTSANWHGGVPTADRDIVIPVGASNYPTGASAPNVNIGTGKYFIMEPGSRATINSLTNNGNTLLQTSETEHSSLIANSHSGNNASIEIYLRSGTFTTESGQFNRWHYISSPFTSLEASVFTGTTINLAQWVESSADASLIQGWIAYDGYNYGTGTITGPTFNSLTPGIGYNYYYTSPVTYTLSGQINTSNISRSLNYTDPDFPTQFGLNLTGNPFPSGLDWDAITDDVSFPANTSKVLHYTKDDEHVYYNNGIGSIPGMNGIIPPMQGFFVKTYNETTPALTLSASARVHDNIPQRYKGKQAIPYVRLSLFSGEYYSDNTVVRFDNEAKEGFDYDFDAVKYFISDRKSSVYTFTEGKKYAINGQPFPAETLELPLHLKVLTAGNLKVALSEIEELDNYRVRLKDNQENITIDLKVMPEYSFSSPAGTITDRFTIIFSDLATNSEPSAVTETVFRTWHAYGVINIVPDNELWDGNRGTITLTDISGRRISSQGNVAFHKGTPLQIAAPQASGIYIVEIESGLKRWTGRVAVRK